MQNSNLISSLLKAFSQEEIELLLEEFPNGIVALDFETTGLSPLIDKVIEVAAIKIDKNGFQVLQELLDPEIPIPEISSGIHGIYDDDVKGKRTFKDVLEELLTFLGGLPLLAHNAQFDAGYILTALHQSKIKFPNSKVLCSLKISRKVFKNLENHRLQTLIKHFEIPVEKEHRAFEDSLACLKVLTLALLNMKENSSSKKFKASVLNESHIFNFSEFESIEDFSIPKRLNSIKEAIATQSSLSIKYSGGSMKGVFRKIKPVSFLPLPNGCVLYAHCLESNLFKYFSIKKIVEIKKA